MIQLKHLCAYLPYGLKYYPSEKSDLFNDLYADHAMDSTWDYIHALENNDEYALKIKSSYLIPCDTFIATEDGEIFLGQFKSSLGFDVDDVFLSEVKPILRPMSDLDKTILTKDGYRNFAKINELYKDSDGDWVEDVQADYSESPSAQILVTGVNWWLFENHFDVFGLIEQNLAISINDLEK